MKTKALHITLFFLMLSSLTAWADKNFDATCTEAYISNHKAVRSILVARSAAETCNESLHNICKKDFIEQNDIEDKLNQYTQAFDVIDALIMGAQTVLNSYTTYQSVSSILPEYVNTLETYAQQVKKRKRIEVADTIIITIAQHGIEKIQGQVEHMVVSLGALAAVYATEAGSKTATVMEGLEEINATLDMIELTLKRMYRTTWHYINVRRVYFSKAVEKARSKKEICDGALADWLQRKRDAITSKTE
ncbi:MAG: hypothetical protein LIP09_09890 [Bacteroidales bacterium]|nr:hypothetical protein [Bacteroidales bacterium]